MFRNILLPVDLDEPSFWAKALPERWYCCFSKGENPAGAITAPAEQRTHIGPACRNSRSGNNRIPVVGWSGDPVRTRFTMEAFMALPFDSNSATRDHVRDRRAMIGVWMLVAIVMLFVVLAFAPTLG